MSSLAPGVVEPIPVLPAKYAPPSPPIYDFSTPLVLTETILEPAVEKSLTVSIIIPTELPPLATAVLIRGCPELPVFNRKADWLAPPAPFAIPPYPDTTPSPALKFVAPQ